MEGFWIDCIRCERGRQLQAVSKGIVETENCQQTSVNELDETQTMAVLANVTARSSLRISTAGFSCLAPGVHIVPHTGYRGYSDHIYRVHLGLVVPTDGDVALQVGAQVQTWQEGKVLAFNDLCLHEAWNRSQRNRIVLLLDIERTPGSLKDFTPAYTVELQRMLQQFGNEPTAATSTVTML
jgi:aspartyl/asparaginyl beta-hydroxylase (cupin superfamily)